MRRHPLQFVIAFALAVVWQTFAFAQGANASVTGTVADGNGAAVASAKVIAQNIKTGVTTTATTNDAGIYSFPSLQPGVYRFSAEKTGFRKLAYNEVTLDLLARVTVDFALEVGQLNEQTVEINASLDTQLSIGTNSAA
jgi:hypothetical protein